MSETRSEEPGGGWLRQWQLAWATTVAASSWILTHPVLARLMHWRCRTVAGIQNILGPISGLVWGRIGWIGVRRYGFSTEDAFLSGGLAGALAPTVELTLRRLGWPPGRSVESDIGASQPPLIANPFTWFGGFVLGGLAAALGAMVARLGQE